MLPEYDFSKGVSKSVRGRFAQTFRENGYSVTLKCSLKTGQVDKMVPVQ
jgi:hypothetical protein